MNGDEKGTGLTTDFPDFLDAAEPQPMKFSRRERMDRREREALNLLFMRSLSSLRLEILLKKQDYSRAKVEALRGKQTMKKLKHGWVEGSAKEFLGLSDADVEFIETRRALSRLLKDARTRMRLTQVEVAERLQTSQSRVAKMEKADPTVSSDLLLQSLFRLGLKRKELAKAI